MLATGYVLVAYFDQYETYQQQSVGDGTLMPLAINRHNSHLVSVKLSQHVFRPSGTTFQQGGQGKKRKFFSCNAIR